MAFSLCSPKFLFCLFLISAIAIAFLVSLELKQPTTHVYHYHSNGWLRECAKWDDLGRRFLVSSLSGGLGEISVPEDHSQNTILQEVQLVKDVDLTGNASLGLVIDRPRNRLLVAVADLIGNRYAALAAYDLSTWKRLFLTQLSGPSKFLDSHKLELYFLSEFSITWIALLCNFGMSSSLLFHNFHTLLKFLSNLHALHRWFIIS